jgi:hypothetical protein
MTLCEILVLFGLSAIAFLVVSVRRIAAPIWVSLLIALVIRVSFAGLTSRDYTPNDVTSYFHSTGKLVLHGQDPVSHLLGRQWNFLLLMPYVHALEIKSGLPWVYAVKIAPIACDVLMVWLVSRLATTHSASRALQYAVNPLSLLVVSVHGQVEPVALALAVSGLLLARRDRWFLAGVLVGAAVAAKTWPLLIAVALLPGIRPKKLAEYVAGGVVVPAALLASGVLFLDTHPVSALQHIASYGSLVQLWGWSGTFIAGGRTSFAGYDSGAGHVGSVLVVLAVVATLVLFRRYPAEVCVMAALCGSLIVTAGFGVQYLMWPLPFMIAAGRRAYIEYVLVAAGFDGVFYLGNWNDTRMQLFLMGMSWLVIMALARVYWDAWQSGRRAPEPPLGYSTQHPEPSEVSA